MSLDRRRMLLCRTAASGDIRNLIAASEAAGLVLSCREFCAAAASGNIATCEWLHQIGVRMTSSHGLDPVRDAASAGHRHMVEWLIGKGLTPQASATFEALRQGHADLAEWLLPQCPDWRRDAEQVADGLAAVARGCDLATLQRLFSAWMPPLRPEERNEGAGGAGGDDGGGGDGAAAAPPNAGDGGGQPPPAAGDVVAGVGAAGGGAAEAAQPPPALAAQVGRLRSRHIGRILRHAAGSPTPDWLAKLEWLEGELCGGPPAPAAAAAAASVSSLPAALDAAALAAALSAAVAAAAADPDGAAADYRFDSVLGGAAGMPASSASSASATVTERIARLLARGYPLTDYTLKAAAAAANEPLVQLLIESGVRVTRSSLVAAAEAGSVPALRALRAAADPETMERFLMDCLVSGRERGCFPFTMDKEEHEGVVAWLAEELGWEARLEPALLLGAAASLGSVGLMRWLTAERGVWWRGGYGYGGCYGYRVNADLNGVNVDLDGNIEVDDDDNADGDAGDAAAVWEHAAEGGCREALDWLADAGCPMEPLQGRPYVIAAAHGDLATIRALRSVAYPWGARGGCLFAECVRTCDVPALQCLLVQCCPHNWSEAAVAAESALLDQKAWTAAAEAEAAEGQGEEGAGGSGATGPQGLQLERERLRLLQMAPGAASDGART
ncbi:hypothetical protein GPECTOR_8g313 [Gonium pectorale]|uniref:Ankyrin repeat domain-containing protein n=1 Tax=Gonium pectorale TaxID=33097 RepID=A0A150GTC6_GONPE|nr:hypothetical protein GPECTOR_8g313 [Gonium pectorale]|eukprot:KXZ52938.1 hypothetical protein GPECTOR_8g313 [Gonium pectorale]